MAAATLRAGNSSRTPRENGGSGNPTEGLLASIMAQNPQLGEVQTLPKFLESRATLTEDERRLMVDQARLMIEGAYVHLPLKAAMHAIAPVQALRLLHRRVGRLTERAFHRELLSIFISLRDFHTGYTLPTTYSSFMAFLPFAMSEYYDEKGSRRYILTGLAKGFAPEGFQPGVEIVRWSGVPIEDAVAIVAERESGSNDAARHTGGLDTMTTRWLGGSLPPDEAWVIVGYVDERGDERETRVPWFVAAQVPPREDDDREEESDEEAEIATAQAVNIDRVMTNQARSAIFGRSPAEAAGGGRRRRREQEPGERKSKYPETFEYSIIESSRGPVGYLGIATFLSPLPGKFIREVVRFLKMTPPDGLIIDVRGNPGGIVKNGIRMLQLFTPRRIKAERMQFINTDMTLAVAASPSFGGFANKWFPSIDRSIKTGSIFSQPLPIEAPWKSNAVGQKYTGPVVLITDARSYSTADTLAAGFQDNRLGVILGVDDTTGGGGANVFTIAQLDEALRQDSPFTRLPGGANMRVAIRRTVRVGRNTGVPVEDLGVESDEVHRLTRRDLLEEDQDLIARAVELLGDPRQRGDRMADDEVDDVVSPREMAAIPPLPPRGGVTPRSAGALTPRENMTPGSSSTMTPRSSSGLTPRDGREKHGGWRAKAKRLLSRGG